MGLNFEWSPKKAQTNLKKHGVSFQEAATVFGDPLAGIKDNPEHSDSEERFIIIGLSHKSRILVIVFTERHDAIRIINARRATNRERKQYQEQYKK